MYDLQHVLSNVLRPVHIWSELDKQYAMPVLQPASATQTCTKYLTSIYFSETENSERRQKQCVACIDSWLFSAVSLYPKGCRCSIMASNHRFSSSDLSAVLSKHKEVPGATVAVICNHQVQSYVSGYARLRNKEAFTDQHYIQCASLSKTIAAAFAHEYFHARGVPMTTSVNELLRSINSPWLITSAADAFIADDVTLAMLVNHTALGMHYVYGIPLSDAVPTPLELINGSAKSYGYEFLRLERPAGTSFSYSGGGFVVMQYLLESMEGRPIDDICRPFLDGCGLRDFTFTQLRARPGTAFAFGHKFDTAKGGDGEVTALAFPPLAAGALCTPSALATFLCHLSEAYHCVQGSGSVSHRTALHMLSPQYSLDLGAIDFMGAEIGSGVFVATAGANKIMLHQAANDGLRGLYMLCFDGPDRGKGFVVLSNGDNPAVAFQCELTRLLLGPRGLSFSGVDFAQYKDSDLAYNIAGLKQETIVNRGLKDLVTSAFINKHNGNLHKLTAAASSNRSKL